MTCMGYVIVHKAISQNQAKHKVLLLILLTMVTNCTLMQMPSIVSCLLLTSSKILHERLFSNESKVHNLNDHSNCAIWMIIRVTVFWTVCSFTGKFISRCVIWSAQFNWRSGPSFELCNSNDASLPLEVVPHLRELPSEKQCHPKWGFKCRPKDTLNRWQGPTFIYPTCTCV